MKPAKPGTTRLAFAALPIILAIMGFVTCLYAWRADVDGLKELALLFAGSITGMGGLILGYYFGKSQS